MQVNINKKETVKYQLVYFLRYMGDSFFYPFISLFLTSGLNNGLKYQNLNPKIYSQNGLSIEYAGYLLMLMPFVSIFINPLWSLIGRHSNLENNKKFVTVLSLIEGLLIIFISTIGMNFTILFIVLFLIAISGQPVYLLLDSFTKVYSDNVKIDYVKIRVFGSISYVVGAILSGFILKFTQTNYLYIFAICGVLFILTSTILIFVKPVVLGDKKEVCKANLHELFTNKNFYAILFFFLFSYGTMNAIDTFVPNYFDTRFNFGASNYSYLLAAFVIVEVILMFILAKYHNKLNIKKLAFLMVFLLSSRWLVLALSNNLYISIIAQLLRGISMAIYIFIFLKIVAKCVNVKNLTAAIIFISSIISLYRVLIIFIGGKQLYNPSNYLLWFIFGSMLSLSSIFYLKLIVYKKIKS